MRFGGGGAGGGMRPGGHPPRKWIVSEGTGDGQGGPGGLGRAGPIQWVPPASSHFSQSMAAAQPEPAAVIAWR